MKTHTLRVRALTLPSDLQTPVGIYLRLRDLYANSALLESTDFASAQNSHSFVGVRPMAKFAAARGKISLSYPDGTKREIEIKNARTLPDALQDYLKSYEVRGESSRFNGLFGYTAYDAVENFESVKITKRPEGGRAPDMLYILYRYVIVINHFHNRITILENVPEGAESEVQEILGALRKEGVAQYPFKALGETSSDISDEEYMRMVERGIAHVRRGDVFQIVLSRGYSRAFTGDDFNAYRALRCINPSPYLFYFDFGSFRIFGSSPETHLRVENGRAHIDPIAGTFRRSADGAQDAQIAASLLEDEKENAEHIMLVDLARNDLSREAEDVRIEFLRQIQYYSHVIHMVSRVSAKVPEGGGTARLFAATFPAGTLSGAPKVRAMQLIDEIEPRARGFYGGCIGHIGFDGGINQAITIRSFMSEGNVLRFQAGAGVVAASDPKAELEEVKSKLGALVKALQNAEEF